MGVMEDKENLWTGSAMFVCADQRCAVRELLVCRLWEE